MPCPAYSYEIAVVKLFADLGIPLVVDLVGGEDSNVWAKFTLIEHVLLVLDLDIFLPRLNFRAICIRASKALVQFDVALVIFQLSHGFERGTACSHIHSHEFCQSQVRIFQLSLRVNQFRPLVGERYLCAPNVQSSDGASLKPLPLRLELLFQHPDRILTHANFCPI